MKCPKVVSIHCEKLISLRSRYQKQIILYLNLVKKNQYLLLMLIMKDIQLVEPLSPGTAVTNIFTSSTQPLKEKCMILRSKLTLEAEY